MSLINGLEYMYNTKQKLKTRLQGKGVNVADDTPFREYPDMLESELKNKSWQYPSMWAQLTPKAEFPDKTFEVIFFDADYDFRLYFSGVGSYTFTLYGGESGGIFKMNDTVYNLNQEYTLTSNGYKKLRFTPGTGITSQGFFTTYKLVVTYSDRLTTFYCTYLDTSHITSIPILAFRAKDTSAYTKTIYFGSSHTTSSGSTIRYRGEANHMQYCDLSMVNKLTSRDYMFIDCSSLIKAEFPEGFVAPNNCFYANNNLREVIGMDMVNQYERTNVFYGCYKFTPPSFNYIGSGCYNNCKLYGRIWYAPDIEEYPEQYFISTTATIGYLPYDEGEITNKFMIILSDKTTKFSIHSLQCMSNYNAIIQLPSCHATITTEPKYNYAHSNDALFWYPYLIRNGDNFYLDKPIGITLGAYYGEDHLYLPHVPLRFLDAYCSTQLGHLKKITFDWENTDFDTSIGAESACVIDIRGQQFEHDTLVELFESLPPVTTIRGIAITNNPGAKTLTDEEIAIVTDKGYTLTK